MFLRLLAPSNRALLGLHEDSTINAGDLEDLRGYADDGELTDAEAEAFISLATSLGLIDQNQSPALGSAEGHGGGEVAAGAAAEIPVFVINLSRGDFGGAALSGVLLVFDGPELYRAVSKVLRSAKTGLTAVREGIQFVNRFDVPAGIESLADSAGLAGSGVVISDAGYLAATEARSYEEIFGRVVAEGVNGPQAEAYTDAYFASLRETLDDPGACDDLLPALRSDPAGPDAYVRWGDEVLDGAGGVVDDFADAVRGCPFAFAENSFGGSTYVVLADGSRKRIESVQVGDPVSGWNTSHGLVVRRTIKR